MTSSFTSLAFYLPQFHEIPENNAWWGEGFTEWTQLRTARSWSEGHVLRRPIAPLGEYKLTDPATLELQWDIAARYGIDGFAVWDYWFGAGRQLLEKPIELVLEKKLRFRYCLSWANHSWYDKSNNRLLCQQQYLGAQDYAKYFERCCRHFESDNYVRIDGKPVFLIFDLSAIPDRERFLEQWQDLARRRGFPGIYFVADRLQGRESVLDYLDKYSTSFRFLSRRNRLIVNYVKEHLSRRLSIELGPRWFDFRRLLKDSIPNDASAKFAPTIMTGWDTTPRHGRRGVVFEHLDASAFRIQLKDAEKHFARFPGEHRLLLLKSWNEWAEGNILEPDSVYGYQMLEAFRSFRESQ